MSKIRQNIEYYRTLTDVETDIGADNVSDYYANSNHIDNSITLYVSTTGTSGGTGLIGDAFDTLSTAMAWIKDYSISDNAIVTIQIADGVYTSTAVTNLNYSYGHRIEITGETDVDDATYTFTDNLTASRVPYSGNSSVTGNSVQITLSNVVATGTTAISDIADGDFIHIDTVRDTGRISPLLGLWQVVSTTVDSVTIDFKGYNGSLSSLGRDITAKLAELTTDGDFRLFKTILQSPDGGLGITSGHSIRHIRNMMVENTDTAYAESGIYMIGRTKSLMTNVGVYGFIWGHIAESTSQCFYYRCVASNCFEGFLATQASSIWITDCMSNANGEGFVAGVTSGIYSSRTQPSTAVNNHRGFTAKRCSSLDIVNDSLLFNTIGGYAEGCSFISNTGASLSNNDTNYDPAENSLVGASTDADNNFNAYIYA